MSMFYELLGIFAKMGLKIEIPKLNLCLFDTSKLEKLIYARVVKKRISMKLFKRQINRMFLEEKESVSISTVDTLLKGIFDQIGINLSEEVLYPFRTALINDHMTNQDLAYNEIMKEAFKEIESCNVSNLYYFISITYPKLTLDASKKYFGASSKPPCRLMEMFCNVILNEWKNKQKM